MVEVEGAVYPDGAVEEDQDCAVEGVGLAAGYFDHCAFWPDDVEFFRVEFPGEEVEFEGAAGGEEDRGDVLFLVFVVGDVFG